MGTTAFNHPIETKNGALIFMPPFPADNLISLDEPDVYAQNISALYPIGTLLWYPGVGKKYRYSKAATALTGLKFLVACGNYVPDGTGYSDHHGYYGHCAVDDVDVAYAVGATELSFTDTHDKAKDFYAGGYLIHFDASRAVCYETSYIISGPAAAITTPWQNTKVVLATPKKYAVVAADGIEIWCNPYANIRQGCVSSDAFDGYETYMGVPEIPVTSGYYFWLQTAGPVFITPNGWSTLCPGYAANSRVVMAGPSSGNITTQAASGAGYQVIGDLLSVTLATCADAFVNMKLDIGG